MTITREHIVANMRQRCNEETSGFISVLRDNLRYLVDEIERLCATDKEYRDLCDKLSAAFGKEGVQGEHFADTASRVIELMRDHKDYADTQNAKLCDALREIDRLRGALSCDMKPGECLTCHHAMEPVRPGKHRVRVAELTAEIERLHKIENAVEAWLGVEEDGHMLEVLDAILNGEMP